MKEYAVKVYWEVSGEVQVKAKNKAQALLAAEAAELPKNTEIVPDSFNVDEMDVQEIKRKGK